MWKQLTKALLEEVMPTELTYELGYEKHDKEAIKGRIAGMGRPKRQFVQSMVR